eukprot:2569882-Pyramimonas_sp.AAC.1
MSHPLGPARGRDGTQQKLLRSAPPACHAPSPQHHSRTFQTTAPAPAPFTHLSHYPGMLLNSSSPLLELLLPLDSSATPPTSPPLFAWYPMLYCALTQVTEVLSQCPALSELLLIQPKNLMAHKKQIGEPAFQSLLSQATKQLDPK